MHKRVIFLPFLGQVTGDIFTMAKELLERYQLREAVRQKLIDDEFKLDPARLKEQGLKGDFRRLIEAIKEHGVREWHLVQWARKTPQAIMAQLAEHDQIYVMGHGDDAGKSSDDIYSDTDSSLPGSSSCSALSVSTALEESGLRKAFAGKIKIHACNSAANGFMQAAGKQLKKDFPECQVFGYKTNLYGFVFPSINDAGGQEALRAKSAENVEQVKRVIAEFYKKEDYKFEKQLWKFVGTYLKRGGSGTTRALNEREQY